MTPRRCMFGVGLLFLVLGITPLAKVIEAQQKDWYWTHQDMKLSLSAAKNYAEIIIYNQRVDDLFIEKSLLVKRNGHFEPLEPEALTFRVNKKYEIIFYDAVFAAFFIASGVTAIICSFFSRKVSVNNRVC